MSLEANKIADLRVKHLEMTQAVISRLATYSAALKNFALTVATAVCGFAASRQEPNYALLAFFPILAFAYLDTQYLRLERRMRTIFDRVRNEDWSTPPSFQIDDKSVARDPFFKIAFSWSISVFYGVLITGVVAVNIALRD